MALAQISAGLLAALLPEGPRTAVERRVGVDVALASCLLGLVQFFAGGLFLVDDFLTFVPAQVSHDTGAFLEAAEQGSVTLDDGDAELALYWSGAFSWAHWIVRPWTWFLAMLALVGLVRLATFAVTQEAVGEPLVVLAWKLGEIVRARARAGAERARFGGPRPDRVLVEGDDLVVLSHRRAAWHELSTIAVGERFYRLAGVEERLLEGRRWYAHRLREEDETAVLRGLVRYEPPDGTVVPQAAPPAG